MPGGRDFSYEVGDDVARVALSSTSRSPQQYQPYLDSPNRDMVSPPPQYSSPPPHLMHRSSVNHDNGGDVDADSDDGPDQPPAPPPHSASPVIELPMLQTSQVQDSMLRPPSLSSTPSSFSHHPADGDSQLGPYGRNSRPASQLVDRHSYNSNTQLPGAAATPGSATPIYDARAAAYSDNSMPLSEYRLSQGMPFQDSPYHRSSQYLYPAVSQADINPNNIIDDGDDGFMPEPQRRSMFPIPSRERSGDQSGYVGAGSAATSLPGILGRLVGKKDPTSTTAAEGLTAEEKSEWLSRQKQGSHRMRWVVGLVICAIVVIAIVAGVVGGVLGSRHGSSWSSDGSSSTEEDSDSPVPGSTNNAETDLQKNGDLSIHSKEIQALMNNAKLHKVFPAIDYTPWGTQYPLCLTYPPSSNNVTRDMAVLSQLTNTVRLYGTDCNQTEMVLHSIKQLELTEMKIWLGVWIDTNQTTTNRQIAQMYDILEANKDDLSVFKGVIIGNEALYRAGEDKAQSEQELIEYLNDARSKFTSNGYNLPIATSDLGDNWNAQLVKAVDYVMSNIHPFFAGVTAEVAASWTWTFWQEHDVVLTQGNSSVKQAISETGWPSGGGTDCGGTTGECASGQSGAVASVENMNTFMQSWVCQALENGTDYFWFEAFDEPWKVVYDKGDQNWEDKWGLMDPSRKLKSGLDIPDCGGKTVS